VPQSKTIGPQATQPANAHTFNAFVVFALLWAVALLSHLFFYGEAFLTPVDVAVTCVALAVLLDPTSAWRLLALALCHVAAVVYHLPDRSNHWFFAGLNSLAFLLTAGSMLLSRRGLDPAQLLASFAPVARLNLICLYYFSALHKLNTDYLFSGSSCGIHTYGRLLQALPFLPATERTAVFAGHLGVFLEFALPTLLLTRRFRTLAVLMGIVFHLGLGLAGFPRFSVIAYALLALFLVDTGGLAGRILGTAKRNATLTRALRWMKRRWWLLIGLHVAVGMILKNMLKNTEAAARTVLYIAGDLTFAAFIAITAMMLAAAAASFHRHEFAEGPGLGFPVAVKAGLLATALLAASGLAPYLGLKTLNVFAMYSNLRTEGGSTNHLFIPSWVQRFGYQRDLADIEATNLPSLSRVVESDLLIPYQQLRSEVSRARDAGRKRILLVYHRDGRTIRMEDAGNDSRLGPPVNPLVYRFLSFRAVEKSGPRACTN